MGVVQSRWQFRTYRPEDLTALVDLDRLCFQPPFRFSRAIMQRLAESPEAVTLLALEADTLAGFAIADLERDQEACIGYVMTLDVHPEYRRNGVARELLWRIEKNLRDRGAVQMLLHVWTENKPAIRLYASSGYTQVLREKDFYDEGTDGFLFVKRFK